MELTVDQALQQGVTAHQEGKLEDAERLYRAILQSEPLHPDANHNLGVLAVSANKADAALPLFKTAIETNPKIDQFWLSYIYALIKDKQLDSAKQVLQQAKKQGVAGEQLNALEAQLAPQTQIENVSSASPSKKQLNRLLEFYQKGRFDDAEKLAVSITNEFPKHQFGWKVLGAVLKKTGRVSESLVAKRKTVRLASQDAEAHTNLGNTLKELGRLDEAEDSYTQAIAVKPDHAVAHYNLGVILKELGRLDEAEASYTQAIAVEPDYAEAHSNLGVMLKEVGRLEAAEASLRQVIALKPDLAEGRSNLGNTLKELGRLEDAEASYTQAIALQPDYAEAHSNLGITLQELGRLEEAEASCRQAIALKPDLAEAHSNLGITLQELGRLDESEASYTQAIALKPDYVDAMFNLSIALSYMNNLKAEIVPLQNILQIDSDDYGLRASVNLAICNFLDGDFKESKNLVFAAGKIQEKMHPKFKNEKAYQEYLLNILKWHEDNSIGAKKGENDIELYVLGESHSLTSHHLRIQNSGINFFCSARLIKGCKQWHLGNAFRNQYKYQFEGIFCTLPKNSYVLLAIGEIDCRIDSGIIAHKKKFPEKQTKEIILTTVKNYLTYIVNNNSKCQHKVVIQGVPCPNIDIRNHSQKDIKQLVEVINIFNCELKMQSKEKGFGFLDTHQLTNKGDELSNGFWHVDDYHLSPEGMQEAWRRYTSEHPYESAFKSI